MVPKNSARNSCVFVNFMRGTGWEDLGGVGEKFPLPPEGKARAEKARAGRVRGERK